jgi:hypothetical protein
VTTPNTRVVYLRTPTGVSLNHKTFVGTAFVRELSAAEIAAELTRWCKHPARRQWWSAALEVADPTAYNAMGAVAHIGKYEQAGRRTGIYLSPGDAVARNSAALRTVSRARDAAKAGVKRGHGGTAELRALVAYLPRG